MLFATILLVSLATTSSFGFSPAKVFNAVKQSTLNNLNNMPVSNTLLRMATKEAPVKIDSMSDGMFTQSSPDTKRVIPTNLEGKRKYSQSLFLFFSFSLFHIFTFFSLFKDYHRLLLTYLKYCLVILLIIFREIYKLIY